MREITPLMWNRVLSKYKAYFAKYGETHFGPKGIARAALNDKGAVDRELGREMRRQLLDCGMIRSIGLKPNKHHKGQSSLGHDPEVDEHAEMIEFFVPGSNW